MREGRLKSVRWIPGLIFLSLLCSGTASAGTYYVDASAVNDSGNGSVGSPKKYLESGLALLSAAGGDTLIVRNGTYSTANDQMTGIPSGTSSATNIVRAENEGGAIITATGGFNVASSYVQIEGFKFSGPWEKALSGNHVKILRCAFEGGPSTANVVNFDFGGSYNLVEDCWFYGTGGRYKVLIYRADHNIARRIVIRDDGGWTSNTGDPEAGIVVYESNNISLQNVLVIDSSLNTYDDNNVGAFYLTGHGGNPSSNNIEYLGCMAINNKRAGIHVDTDDGGVGLSLTDFVIYGSQDEILGTSNTSMNMTVNRATFGNSSDRYIGNWGTKSITMLNSVLWSSAVESAGGTSVTYSNSYNLNEFAGIGVTHLNPLANGLLYLPRIEDGSVLKTGGSSNGQRGAQIVYRTGTSGSLHGGAGYNALTGTALWPWPNEARIKADMASYSGLGPSGVRGFTAGTSKDGSPQTLTKYIWEYLGNQIPADIYNPGPPDTTAPVISAFTLPATSTSLVVLMTTFAATDNIGVSGYMITESSTPPTAGAAGWSATAPTSFAFAGPGLRTAYGWVKDAAGNVSASASQNVTITQSDSVAPTVATFVMPSAASTLTVSVSAFTATDNTAVTGYMITDNSTAPSVGAAEWSATAPSSFTFSIFGSQTAYAWAKDAAGNVSSSAIRTVTLDATAPTVGTFTMPTTSTSLTVSITTFTASDNIAVTGYLITGTTTAPLASDPGWSATAPTSFTFASAGPTKKAYAWVKDAAGNISTSKNRTVNITLADTTAPVVNTFTIPATATSLTVSVSSFTATDAVGVTGYLITESATAPSFDAALWTEAAPTSYTAASAGAHTLYPWVKDSAGNVSAVFGSPRSVTINLVANPDTTKPNVSITAPASGSTARGVVTITASASDNIAVTRVEFFVDGILSGTKNAAPWTTSWDSAAHLNKTYSLTAKAFDAAGNFQASSPVSIIVNRKPSPPTGLRAERR